MNFTLDTFASQVRDTLQRDPSRAGREKVRVLIESAPRRVYVCTRCLKAGKVQKAL